MNNDKLLAKFEGRCWHERENQYGSMCRLCGATLNYMSPINPSYSTSPDDRERLWGYLVGKEMVWEEFGTHIYRKWVKDFSPTIQFIPWFSAPPRRHSPLGLAVV